MIWRDLLAFPGPAPLFEVGRGRAATVLDAGAGRGALVQWLRQVSLWLRWGVRVRGWWWGMTRRSQAIKARADRRRCRAPDSRERVRLCGASASALTHVERSAGGRLGVLRG
eukprot:1894571-Rhodomonas_salina.1